MQLLVRGKTTPLPFGTMRPSITLVSTTSPTTSPSERITASTGMTGFVGTAFSSSSPPSTTSPSSSSSMSTMTRSLTTRPSTSSIDIHSSSSPIITTESSTAQDRSSGMKKSVITVLVVLLIVLLIALIVGVFWYKRRGKLATSKRNQQSRSPNGIVQNPTFQNDDSEHEYAEYPEKPSTKGTTRISSSSEDAQQHIYSDLPASASKDNNGVIYNEVGEQDYNVPFGGKEMGDYHEYNLPDSDHGRSNAKDPTNEDSYQELSEDGKKCSPKGTQGTTRISSSEDSQQHIYSDLPASASKDSNGVIYNEVGEQDYNVPFGGKEMGDYHEYNLPDTDHGRSNVKDPTNEESYQELSEDGKRCSPKGIERHALPGMTEKAIESQPKVGEPSRTGGHAYQDLRKDDGGYTSLGLPQKPVTKVTAAELENSYQALHADGPDYFTLKPNETKPSPNPDNLQNSTYQPLRQEPEYAILESEQSDNPAKPVDNTYQSLLKDANNHADSDIEHRKDNTPKQGQSDPYDVLQRGPKTKQLSLDGYGSLGPTAKEEEEHDYESPEGKPKATTDYEDPIQDNSVADGPYDSLQRNAMPEPPRSSPSLANRAVDDGDDDDYETPDRSNDDPTDANYQTLDNRQEKSDSGNEEYSHLHQSPLTEQSSDDETSLHVHSDQNSDTQPEDEQSLESVTSGATFEHYLVSDIEQPMAMTTPSLDNSGGNSRVHGIEQIEGSTKTSEGPGVHSSAKALKKTVAPTWVATNSLLVQAQQKGNQSLTKSAIVAPLLRRPPTDYSSLFTILSLAQGISAAVVGPHKKTVITLDLDLYERATKLQSSTGNKNWILRIGELHACFASLHAIAKYLEDSGLESISIEAGLFSPSTIRQIFKFTGKWFKRGIKFHMTNIMACYDLLFEASVHHEHLDSMIKKCEELCKKLHERDSDIKQVFEEVTSMIKEHYQTTIIQENDEMATFLLNYMKQVESLLHVIRASRQGNWELHLASMEEQVKYYFAHDLYKYARLVPIYLLQMHSLKTSDPTTWDALKAGDFMVTKSGIPFTNLFVDQTLEQLIREVKVAGGITGITQNEEALGRFFLIAPELVILVQDFQDAYCCTTNDSQTTKEHYQLSGSVALRMHRNSSTIKKAIIRHCEGNPFEIRSMKLMNMVSNMQVPEAFKEDILERDKLA
eukprot:XP_011666855.1 PREDICTED: uncharacterized protein LOC105439492 [Strongylocentrotus purpuratus]